MCCTCTCTYTVCVNESIDFWRKKKYKNQNRILSSDVKSQDVQEDIHSILRRENHFFELQSFNCPFKKFILFWNFIIEFYYIYISTQWKIHGIKLVENSLPWNEWLTDSNTIKSFKSVKQSQYMFELIIIGVMKLW